MLGASVSVSSYARCVVDSEGHALLVSSIVSDSYNLPLLLQDSLSSERRDLMEVFYLGPNVPRSLILCVISDCGSLYLLPSAAGGSLSVNV